MNDCISLTHKQFEKLVSRVRALQANAKTLETTLTITTITLSTTDNEINERIAVCVQCVENNNDYTFVL